MNKISANSGVLVSIVVSMISFLYFLNNDILPLKYMPAFLFLDIWLFMIAFEYQRITQTIARIIKLKDSDLDIFKLQIMMSNSIFGASVFILYILSGFIYGYIASISVFYLFIFIFIKFSISIFSSFSPYIFPIMHYLK